MQTIDFKTGDTFSLDCQLFDSNGVAVDLTGLMLTSKITGSGLSSALTVTVTNAATGSVNVSASATETSAWPGKIEGLGAAQYGYLDIARTDGTLVKHSPTIRVQLTKGIA